MSYRHALFALVTLCSLAGCAPGMDDEMDDEAVASGEDDLTGAKGTVVETNGMGLRVRSQPNTQGSVLTTLAEGKTVGISCQIKGEAVDGNSVWDYLPTYKGYVSDAFLLTGYDGFLPGVPKCSASPGGGGAGGSTGGSGDGSLGAAAIAEARTHIGYSEYSGDCNKFATYYGDGCIEWCAEFVRYAWGKAGASTGGLGGYSMTFHDYGLNHGTWKPNKAGVVVKPGDAILWGASDYSWGAHIGMVTDVSGETFKTIHGNFDIQGNGTGDDVVYETKYVDRFYTAGTGYSILGFISPAK